jgi:hypothetical protein
MSTIQSFIPVVTWNTRVVGYVPVNPPMEFDGSETSINLGGYEYPLFWIDVDRKNFRNPKKRVASIQITPSQERMSDYPFGFYHNPDYYFAPFYTERSIVHDHNGATDWFHWLFVYGESKEPEIDPGPGPDPTEETDVWELTAEFASNSNCSFVDVDWTQFAPAGTTPDHLELDTSTLPDWLSVMFATRDMSSSMLGATMAETSPTMRLFRKATVSEGEYMIEGVRIHLIGGDTYVFDIRLVVE